jgi:hypothetical protein
MVFGAGMQRSPAVIDFGHDLDPGLLVEQLTQARTRQGFVVGDHDPHVVSSFTCAPR